jgi:hypothetical protein
VIAVAVCLAWSSLARAESMPDFLISGMPLEHRPEATTLAICILAEAGANRLDHHAILHVLKRRALQLSSRSGQHVSTAEMARRYCRIFRDAPKHRLFLRSLAWSQTPERAAYAHAWQQAQLSVVLFLLDVDVDPCDGRSMHWGSTADAQKPPKRAVRVHCGPTRNVFWTGPQRRTSI